MRLLFVTLLISLFSSVLGQHFKYPEIKKTGKLPNDFVPEGWVVLDSAVGQLNNDNTPDLVLILQRVDSVLLGESLGDTIDVNMAQPRTMIIFLKNPDDNLFHLLAQNNHIILKHGHPYQDDPYQSITIKNKILELDLHFYPDAGNNYTRSSYKFRFQNNNLFLIGEEHEDDNKAEHDFSRTSLNYLTRKQTLSTGNWDKHTLRSKASWLGSGKMKSFAEFSTYDQ